MNEKLTRRKFMTTASLATGFTMAVHPIDAKYPYNRYQGLTRRGSENPRQRWLIDQLFSYL